MDATTATIPLCRHLMTNGRQCQSPALRGGPLCFFHAKLQHTHRRPAKPESLASGWQEYAIESEGEPEGDVFAVARVYPNQDEIQFPPLEDAESVQLATSMLFQAIATGQIYFKRAKLLLYTLKIASINQRALANARAADSDKPAPTRIVRTTEGQFLAPAEPQPAPASDEAPPAHTSHLTPQTSIQKFEPPDTPPAFSTSAKTAPPTAGPDLAALDTRMAHHRNSSSSGRPGEPTRAAVPERRRRAITATKGIICR